MRYLIHVNLSDNNLSSLPTALSTLKDLKVLDLSGNQLSLLSEAFGDLVALEELYLQKNSIFQLPSALLKLKFLRVLDVSKNALGHVGLMPPHLKVNMRINCVLYTSYTDR